MRLLMLIRSHFMNDLPTAVFKEEMAELLAVLEASLLEMESMPNDGELIAKVFRALHTIKGSSAMFGLEALSSFTHEVESVFDLVRSGVVQVDRSLINLLLASKDHISCLYESAEGPGKAEFDAGDRLIAAMKGYIPLPDRASSQNKVSTVSIYGYLPVLTDYETSRLRANLHDGKVFYCFKIECTLETMDKEFAKMSSRIKSCGELISTIPNFSDPREGSICFTAIFASILTLKDLETDLGSMPVQIDMSPMTPDEQQSSSENTATFRIRFRPSPDFLRKGYDPLGLLEELRELGICHLVAQTSKIPALDSIDPTTCYTSWDVVLTTSASVSSIRDAFIFVEQDGELTIEKIDDSIGSCGIEENKRLGEILVERGDISSDDLKRILANQKRIGELLVESTLLPQEIVQSALVEQQHLKERRQERHNEETSSIRVTTEKLDSMVNLVGELIIAQDRLSQAAKSRGDALLITLSEEIERLSMALRDDALNIRMIPIGSNFGRFRRLVRDLSNELGKDVEIDIAGSDTELDKTIIDKLNDPLVHLIRNAVDHGIEMPEQRVAAGKPRKGSIRLEAVHSGDSVLLTIRDDGIGLDRNAILAKAVDKGILPPGLEVSDKELFSCIFLPGFSTARTVTGVSGRGVGMDVVKKAIDGMRGDIELHSISGTGTYITIRLPLTLAIIESLLVQIGSSKFVIPLSLVEECVEMNVGKSGSHVRRLTPVRGQLIPYIPLRERFLIAGDPPPLGQMIVTQFDGTRIGFIVDKVIGEHQTVIKPLGRLYRQFDGFSGATILGDGNVALILDIPRMVRQIEREEASLILH
jgi:two-component system chemotaxis sensor kinase CheA